MATENPKIVMLHNVRIAFPVLETPEKFKGETGKPRYSATLLIEKGSANEKKVEAALIACAAEKWPSTKPEVAVTSVKASGKCAFKDGDAKAEYDGFAGMMSLAAHSQASAPPTLLDGQKNVLPRNTGVIYAGCYVNASVEIWALDKSKGYGNQLNANVRGLQFYADGDSFSAARPADAGDFEVVEGSEISDADFSGDADGMA